MRKPNNFTMIELMLALGVCAIGICSIMVLFPIGANANRDAAMETYAANAADQLLHYLQYQLNNNWQEQANAIPSAWDKKDEIVYSSDGDWTKDENFSNILCSNEPDGAFVIQSIRGDPEIVDFRAMLFVWKKQITVNSIKIPENIGVQLNVQVTWPAELPYAARQKALYCLKVFNPNYLKPADD